MEYEDAASRAGRPFIPIYLTCELGVNLERVDNAERLSSGTTKLTDVEVLRDLRANYELFRFDTCPGVDLDSTSVPPSVTARKILEALGSVSSQASKTEK